MKPVGILKFLEKICHILTGWSRRYKLIETNNDIKRLSEERLKICAANEGKCSKHFKLLEILNGKAIYVHTLVCTECGCPCLEKSLVEDEYCPLKKWNP